MAKTHPLAPFDRSSPTVLDRLAKIQRVCLTIVILIAVLTLCAWIISALGVGLSPVWTMMKFNTALAALGSAISLRLSEPHRSNRSLILSRLLAVLVALVAVASLVERALGISLGVDTWIVPDPYSLHPGLMSPESGSSFTLLAVVLFFIRARRGIAGYIADLLAVGVSFLVLMVVSGFLFGAMSPFRVAPSNWTSPQTLVGLMLLNFVAFGRRAEYGVFAILVGGGIAGRIARILAPIVLALPFLREVFRARLIHSRLLPEHYTTAFMASSAAVLAFALLMILSWHIHSMENEIHDLGLRDELTGLYNLRGFHLLAGQALRLAQRAQLPFSVLFIDLDNLKQINDELGHGVGSSFLVETAELLRSTFRETDVVGRVGGDEFAVAGQFSRAGMASAARRLEEDSGSAAPETGGRFPLSLSIGQVTTGGRENETLDDLMAKADNAMYEHKHGKRLQAR